MNREQAATRRQEATAETQDGKEKEIGHPAAGSSRRGEQGGALYVAVPCVHVRVESDGQLSAAVVPMDVEHNEAPSM